MDPDKILKLAAEYFVGWSRIILLTLRNPVARFQLTPLSADDSSTTLVNNREQPSVWLSPKLFAYAVLSIILGISMNSLLPKRVSVPDLLKDVVIVFLFWIVYSSFIFVICRLFRGRASYLDTLSVSIQVLATTYVATSFLSLVAAAVISVGPAAEFAKRIPLAGEMLVDEPPLLFFLFGTILLAIYTPLSMKAIHRFGWFRAVLLSLVPFVMVWGLSLPTYRETGVMTREPSMIDP